MVSLHEAVALRRALEDGVGDELRARYDDALKRTVSAYLLILLARLERAEGQVDRKTEV